jgi:antitoxin (DNA-binding transcriptional repressor) of toxin-antitoxin stability system
MTPSTKIVYTEATMAIGIREARETLPALVKRAAGAGEEITLGARGADEVTLVASRKYARIRREVARLRQRVEELQARLDSLQEPERHRSPFVSLQRSLEIGSLGAETRDARRRRYLPDYTPTGEPDRAERIRTGLGGAVEPEHRRTRPRA